MWQRKQSWARGSIRSLVNVTLSTHFHQNSTILYCEFPHWQVGNGHSHDGMALKRQDIPRSARLRREHMAPEEHHPEYNSHWAAISRNSPNIPNLTLNQSPEDISSICAPLNNYYWCWQQQFKAATGDMEKEKMILEHSLSISAPSSGFHISVPTWKQGSYRFTSPDGV